MGTRMRFNLTQYEAALLLDLQEFMGWPESAVRSLAFDIGLRTLLKQAETLAGHPVGDRHRRAGFVNDAGQQEDGHDQT